MDKEALSEILFPHDKAREVQATVISDIKNAMENKMNVIMHAPTGIGKTASVLAPALSFALKNNLRVFFLTSRQTQHKIAIDTLKEIKKRHGAEFTVADIIAKKWMCLQQGVEAMYANDFIDYCRKLRDKDDCEFYLNTRHKSRRATVKARKVVEELNNIPLHVNELVEECKNPRLCPYEMGSLIAEKAKVIIADYNYIFNQGIRDSLFGRAGIRLEECIIIVDEGHNLPARARELLSAKISTVILDRAIKEADKFRFFDLLISLKNLKDILAELGIDLNLNREEKLVRKYQLVDAINDKMNYDAFASNLIFSGDEIREKQKFSYVGSMGNFLEAWLGQDNGFARILSKNLLNGNLILSYRCLDPSLITKDVISRAYSTIIMSGTLTPTFMFKDILGFENSVEKIYKNPFPKNNRLCLIVPETTTKFTRRNKEEFEKIANICNKIISKINGNVALFFPSYELRDKIYKYFFELNDREKIIEKPNLSKNGKEEILEKFKENKDKGSVLLAVSSGNFGEGIDLPGDFLKAVIVAGLPLQKPDLETKELIDYYEDKFGKGIDYGYIFPAITKCLQNAGRCIRSETDKGVIIFLDERFAWENYYRCFPKDMDFKISKLYEQRIGEFFGGLN